MGKPFHAHNNPSLTYVRVGDPGWLPASNLWGVWMFRSGRRGWRETIKFSIDHLFFKLNLQVSIGLPIVVGHALTFGLKSRQSPTCDSVRIVSWPSLALGVYIVCERFPVLVNDAMPVRCFRDWHTTLTSVVLNPLAEALKLYLSYGVWSILLAGS